MKTRYANLFAAVAGLLPLALICIVSTAHAAGPSAQASVIGGEQARPGQFPWMAFVVDFPGGDVVTACSGTVIAPRVILTAAHCTLDESSRALNDPAGYRVVTGTVNWTDPERQLSDVTRLIPYPKFAPQTARDGFGDAALLVLATPTTAPAIPIATPANKGLRQLGTRAAIAGWGMTVFDQKDFTEPLMWTKTVVAGERCEGLWGRLCGIDFPRGTSGACHGDSGGPLFTRGPHKHNWIEIGIVEGGFGKCTTRRPQLYTRTDLIASWINSRVKEIEAEPALPAAE